MKMSAIAIPPEAENLVDLASFGIKIDNPRGVCYVCHKPIDPFWSEGHSADARCYKCATKNGQIFGGEIFIHDPIYNRSTVWVVPNRKNPEGFDAFVKISGRIYFVERVLGGYDLVNAVSGLTIRTHGLHPAIGLLGMIYKMQQPKGGLLIGLKGQIWFDGDRTYFPKVDAGICQVQEIEISKDTPIESMKEKLGPVGTAIARVLRGLGIGEMIFLFDSVFIPHPIGWTSVGISKAIARALNWEAVDLYAYPNGKLLQTIEVGEKMKVNVSGDLGSPTYRLFKPEGVFEDIFERESFFRPLDTEKLRGWNPRPANLIRALLAINAVHHVTMSPKRIAIFVRAGYTWQDMDAQVREVFETYYPDVQLVF